MLVTGQEIVLALTADSILFTLGKQDTKKVPGDVLQAELCKKCHLWWYFLSQSRCLTSGSCYSCVNEMSEMNFTMSFAKNQQASDACHQIMVLTFGLLPCLEFWPISFSVSIFVLCIISSFIADEIEPQYTKVSALLSEMKDPVLFAKGSSLGVGVSVRREEKL